MELDHPLIPGPAALPRQRRVNRRPLRDNYGSLSTRLKFVAETEVPFATIPRRDRGGDRGVRPARTRDVDGHRGAAFDGHVIVRLSGRDRAAAARSRDWCRNTARAFGVESLLDDGRPMSRRRHPLVPPGDSSTTVGASSSTMRLPDPIPRSLSVAGPGDQWNSSSCSSWKITPLLAAGNTVSSTTESAPLVPRAPSFPEIPPAGNVQIIVLRRRARGARQGARRPPDRRVASPDRPASAGSSPGPPRAAAKSVTLELARQGGKHRVR